MSPDKFPDPLDEGPGLDHGCGWALTIVGTVYLLARYVVWPYIAG